MEITKALYNFTNSISNPNTREKYQIHLNRFLKYIQKDASEFLSLPILDLEQLIIDYIVNMRNQGLSTGYINIAFCAIKHLCIMNDVRINKEKLAKFIGQRTEIQQDRPYTHEEILQLLNVCDLRIKVAVLLMASTGMRIGALPTLRLSHIKENNVMVYAGTPDKYITFMTPECKKAIDNYLEYRKRSGEKITFESFIFREKFDKNDIMQVRTKAKQVTTKRIANALREYLIESGLRTVDHTYNGRKRHQVTLADGFRKFFTKQLIQADVKTEHRWLLEGHELKQNDRYYVRIEEKQLKQEYEKAVNFLTIDPANRLQLEVNELTQKKDEITLMKLKHERELEDMRQHIEQRFTQILQKIDVKKLE